MVQVRSGSLRDFLDQSVELLLSRLQIGLAVGCNVLLITDAVVESVGQGVEGTCVGAGVSIYHAGIVHDGVVDDLHQHKEEWLGMLRLPRVFGGT